MNTLYDTRPIYFAFDAHKQDAKIAADNMRLPWQGFLPEEVGHSYQDLCAHYAKSLEYGNAKCVGGFSMDSEGKHTYYTPEQLTNDYDPTE